MNLSLDVAAGFPILLTSHSALGFLLILFNYPKKLFLRRAAPLPQYELCNLIKFH